MTSTVQLPALRLSKRLAELEPSATIGLIGRIGQLKAQGVPVISFGQGEPDFPTPAAIKAAGQKAIDQDLTRYTPTGGIVELRQAIARRAEEETGIAYTANQITVACGAKEALYLAFQAICNEGDEVIIPAPYWVSYIEQVRLAAAKPIVVDMIEGKGFAFKAAHIIERITPKTRAIILNSPANPTGEVVPATELQALAAAVRGTGIIVISDEIYNTICYNGEYPSWLRLAPDLAEQTLLVNGVSKSYAMTGWRIGYIAGHKEIIEAIKAIQSHSTTHPTSIAQYAALAAYTPSAELDEIVRERVGAFQERRDVIVAGLAAIPGVTCAIPDGAFYVFPNVAGLLNRPLNGGKVCQTSNELANYLLDHAQIGVVPGEAFGAPGYLRLSYAQSKANILEGLTRFAAAVK